MPRPAGRRLRTIASNVVGLAGVEPAILRKSYGQTLAHRYCHLIESGLRLPARAGRLSVDRFGNLRAGRELHFVGFESLLDQAAGGRLEPPAHVEDGAEFGVVIVHEAVTALAHFDGQLADLLGGRADFGQH